MCGRRREEEQGGVEGREGGRMEGVGGRTVGGIEGGRWCREGRGGGMRGAGEGEGTRGVEREGQDGKVEM